MEVMRGVARAAETPEGGRARLHRMASPSNLRWLIALCLCGNALAEDRPAPLRPGLWQTTVTFNGALAGATQQCISAPKQIVSGYLPSEQPPLEGCKFVSHQNVDGVSARMTCTNGKYVGFENHEADAEHWSGTFSTGDATGYDLTMTLVSSWMGVCPADMQDGQIKTPKPLTDIRTGRPYGERSQ